MPRITGRDSASKRIANLGGAEMVALVGQALVVGGGRLANAAQRSITEGAVSGKNHVPSRPGEPPNEDTEHLRPQIEVVQTGPLRVEVSSNARYSAALEYGTSKMAARPFMGPAARSTKPEIVALVRKAVTAATRKG